MRTQRESAAYTDTNYDERENMGRDTQILIRDCPTIEALISFLEQRLSIHFVKVDNVEWKLYQSLYMLTFLSVYDDHDLVNDMDIEFERYSLVLDLSPDNSVKGTRYYSTYYEPWFENFAVLIASILAAELGCECLVVNDLQAIVGLFAPYRE